jgi:hypothetical protein
LQESSQSSSSNSDDEVINDSVIGSAGTVIWLIGMTVVIAVLSNYVITTIEVYTSTLLSCFRFISASLFFFVSRKHQMHLVFQSGSLALSCFLLLEMRQSMQAL